MKSVKLLLAVSALYFVLFQAVSGQQIWEKDWKIWTAKDAEKILYNSPLSKNCANSDVNFPCGSASKSPFGVNNHTSTKKTSP